MQLIEKPICGTKECSNIAIGILNGRWRCGKCIVRFDNKLREMKEEYFKEEE